MVFLRFSYDFDDFSWWGVPPTIGLLRNPMGVPPPHKIVGPGLGDNANSGMDAMRLTFYVLSFMMGGHFGWADERSTTASL